MTRKLWVLFAGLLLVSGLALADAPKTAREYWEQAGSPPVVPGPLAPGTPGTLWDNGAFDLVNGFSSERATVVSGTGGPEGDHGSTLANDFDLPIGGTLDEVRVCFLVTPGLTTAEMYIYADAAGVPGAAPVVGAPTTADLVTTTYTDNTARCASAFGLVGREFQFVLNGSVVLPPGHYWLAVVGDGLGDTSSRAFWGNSSNVLNFFEAQWGSTFFAFPYWTPATVANPTVEVEFAFDIDGTAGQQTTVLEIPTLGQAGFALLAILLGGAAFVALRRSRKTA